MLADAELYLELKAAIVNATATWRYLSSAVRDDVDTAGGLSVDQASQSQDDPGMGGHR